MAILALKTPTSTKDVEISADGIDGKGATINRKAVLDQNHEPNPVQYASNKVADFHDAKKAFGKDLAAMFAGQSLKSVFA